MRNMRASGASWNLRGSARSAFCCAALLALAALSGGFAHAKPQSDSTGTTTSDTREHIVSAPAPEAVSCRPASAQAIAQPLHGQPESDGFPAATAWDNMPPSATFCSDWRGENSNPTRQTNVRVLWSRSTLYLRFQAHYKELTLYPEKNQHRDRLWLRDVAEVFLEPPPGKDKIRYKELEVSPNGNWYGVNVISVQEEKFKKLKCNLKSRGEIDESSHMWTGELAIPMECLTTQFDPGANWRVNFFRIEGPPGQNRKESRNDGRFYSAWRPTNTERPFFHVPDVFGELKFASEQ